jgi:parvulin-like peptidyl-prolyl isomerase
MGANPPEFLVQQFRDSAGTFHRDAYYHAMSDPQNKKAWIEVEDLIRQQERRKKLQSLLFAGVQVTEGEVRQAFADRSVSMDADYALFDVNALVPDNTVQVTEDDLKKAYNEHQYEFHAKASRKIKYVLFSQAASAQDTESVLTDAKHLLDQVNSGTVDFLDMAKTYSDVPVNPVYVGHGELSAAKNAAVFSAAKGSIIGPLKDYDGIHLIKVLDARQGTTDYVHVSHILLNSVAGPDSVKTIARAQELLKQARSGADFAKLARENSQDYGSAQQGGDLGWNKKGVWIKPFEEAAFKAGVGQVIGPIRTQFGWHIIKVLGKDSREAQIADVVMKVHVSSQTADATLQLAQDFQARAKDVGFEKAAAENKFDARETPEFAKTGAIPGLGMNDLINNFAFTNKVGTISDPMYLQNAIAIFKVSGTRDEGVRSFDEVKNSVRPLALKAKKIEKLQDQIDAFVKTISPNGDILAAAQAKGLLAQHLTGVTAQGSIPGVGRDGAFIGTLKGLKPGQISKPVEGNRGIYILKSLAKTAFNENQYKAESESIRSQLLQQKRSTVMSGWQTALREKADIADHRDKFYH